MAWEAEDAATHSRDAGSCGHQVSSCCCHGHTKGPCPTAQLRLQRGSRILGLGFLPYPLPPSNPVLTSTALPLDPSGSSQNERKTKGNGQRQRRQAAAGCETSCYTTRKRLLIPLLRAVGMSQSSWSNDSKRILCGPQAGHRPTPEVPRAVTPTVKCAEAVSPQLLRDPNCFTCSSRMGKVNPAHVDLGAGPGAKHSACTIFFNRDRETALLQTRHCTSPEPRGLPAITGAPCGDALRPRHLSKPVLSPFPSCGHRHRYAGSGPQRGPQPPRRP